MEAKQTKVKYKYKTTKWHLVQVQAKQIQNTKPLSGTWHRWRRTQPAGWSSRSREETQTEDLLLSTRFSSARSTFAPPRLPTLCQVWSWKLEDRPNCKMRLSSGGQTTSGPATTTGSPGLKWSYCYGCNPGLKLHIFEEEAFSTILFCGNCCHHFYCNPGLKLPSCSFEEDSCGWSSVIELNATKWFHFQRLIDINWYIGTCLNQNLSKKTPLPSFSTTGSISRCRLSEIIQISMKIFITIDQDKWKRSLPHPLSPLEIIQISTKIFIPINQDKWKRSPARSAGSRHGPQPRQQRW